MTCRASPFENVSLDEMSCVKTQKGKTRCLVSLVSHSSQAGRPGCKTHGPHLHTQNQKHRPCEDSFSRMRSEGFSFYFPLGVWFHNRSQHDHKWGPLAVPVGNAAKVVTFGGFKCHVASFRKAGVALRDIPTWCQKMTCVCRGRRSALDMSMFISGGSAALCEACFFANRIVRGASSGEKVQIVWQAWRFVTCDEN